MVGLGALRTHALDQRREPLLERGTLRLAVGIREQHEVEGPDPQRLVVLA